MAEINQFLSSEAQKEVENYIASLETIAGKYKEIATASINLEKAKQEELKTENLLLKNKQQAEVLAQKKVKTQADEQKASERIAKALEKENSEYEKLKKNHADAVKRTRELASANKQGTAEFAKASAEAKKYGDQLRRVNDTTGAPATNNVGKYFQAIMKGAGALGLVVGAAQLATKAFEGLKNGSQTFGDAFARSMGAVNGATSVFFSMIGSGNMDNFFQRLADGAKAGRELADALDDMMERGLSIELLEANTNKIISEQEVIRNNVNLTTEERIAAAQRINEEEEKLLLAKQAEANRVFEDYAKNIELSKKVNREELVSFIENYKAQEKLRESVVAKNKELADYDKRTAKSYSADVANNNAIIAGREKIIATYTSQERVYAEFLSKYGELTDDEIKNTIQAYAQITNVETESRDRKLRNETKLNKFIKELNDEKTENYKKTLEEQQKEDDDYLKAWNKIKEEEAALSVKMAQGRLDDKAKETFYYSIRVNYSFGIVFFGYIPYGHK